VTSYLHISITPSGRSLKQSGAHVCMSFLVRENNIVAVLVLLSQVFVHVGDCLKYDDYIMLLFCWLRASVA